MMALHRRVALCAAVCILAAAPSGCVHDVLGEAPTSYDLRNDGSPEAKNHLYNAYRVSYADGNYTRPYGMQYSADATSDAALNYLVSSDAAEDELFSPFVVIDRFHQSPSFYAAIVGVSTVVGAGLGVYSGLFAAGALQQIAAGGGQTVAGVTTASLFVMAGVGAGMLLSLPILLLAEIIAKPMARSLAGPAYRSAARAFNDDLSERIDAHSEPVAAAPDVPHAPPVAPHSAPAAVPEAPQRAPAAPEPTAPSAPATQPGSGAVSPAEPATPTPDATPQGAPPAAAPAPSR